MSTKTNFKRIALVAVASLGLGILSAVPSNAELTATPTLTVTAGTAAFSKSDSTTAATFTMKALVDDIDTFTVLSSVKEKPATATAPTLFFTFGDTATAQVNTSVKGDIASGVSAANRLLVANQATMGAYAPTGNNDSATALTITTASGWNGLTMKAFMDSTTARIAGTYVYTVTLRPYTEPGNGAAAADLQGNRLDTTKIVTADITFTVAAPTDRSTTPSAVTSFVDVITTGVTTKSDGSDDVITGLSTAGTAAGYIYVGNRNSANALGFAQDSITVTVTGAGQVCSTSAPAVTPTATSCGTNIKVSAVGDYMFIIQGNGTAGVGTMTISSSVAGWSVTKSATFYAVSPKTITATVAHPLLKVGTNDGAVRVTGVDAAGVNWTGQFYIYASTAADALIGGSLTAPVACGAYVASVGYASCNVATLTTGTAKFKVIDAATVAAATATSNEVTLTVANTQAATVKLSFDKSTYAPNERARIYVTPLDAAGKEIQSISADLLAAGGISVNGAISYTGSTTTADSLTVIALTTSASTSSTSGAKAGSVVYTVYMPSAGGTVTLTATGGTGLPAAGRVAITASATVTDSGAAALAAVTALATTVASLKTLITTLTNLVLKIQKKVKA